MKCMIRKWISTREYLSNEPKKTGIDECLWVKSMGMAAIVVYLSLPSKIVGNTFEAGNTIVKTKMAAIPQRCFYNCQIRPFADGVWPVISKVRQFSFSKWCDHWDENELCGCYVATPKRKLTPLERKWIPGLITHPKSRFWQPDWILQFYAVHECAQPSTILLRRSTATWYTQIGALK